MTRTLLASLFFFSTIISANAQVKTPRPSPNAVVTQEVGLTDINIAYSRPGKKGRVIFGDLVPYGKLWRTGANMNTTIEFSTDVTINGQKLEKGKYALFTIPGKEKWEIIFYTDYNNGGTPDEWDESKVALKTTVNSSKRQSVLESFRISIENLKSSGADLVLAWEMTEVAIPTEVPTSEIAMASIEATMNGPSARDYASAAQYYLDEKKDMDQAYEWINKSLEMMEEKPFWLLRRKSLIEAELGKKEAAIATAKKSLEAAKAAGNMDYVKMNEDSIKEWSK